jgi:phage-related protein
VAAGGVLVGRGYVSIRPEFEGDWSRSVNSRASSAGKSGAGAFSKAFGAGMRGIGALTGVAIGANLSSAAAGAAVLAPALATAGAAAGALKLGLSGVGEAFKAAFAGSSADAGAAASATRAVESAQRGLANAQRSLADARVQAAERVRDAQKAVADAEQNLARVVEDSAQRQRDAQQSVRDAERDLRDAQQDAREAQVSLTGARIEATRALQDMNQRLAEGRLDEREAVLRLKEAEKELRAAQSKPGTTPEQMEKLRIAYERANLNLKEQREETKRLSADAAKANQAGVAGSEQMQRARERVASANETVADRERGLAKAQEEARRTGVESARDIADAQRALGEAQAGVDKARADGQRQIEDAQRAVADAAAAVADAQAAAAAQTSKFDEAMAKLAPNAQSFVRAVQGLTPAWDAMRLSVQNELFRGLDSTVTTLGRTTIPILQRQLTATAGVWNAMAKNAAGAITEMAKTGMLDKILAGATENLRVFEKAPGQLLTAFGQLTVAAQPAFNALLTQMAGAITSFTDGIAASFESGGLQSAIESAFGIISQFGTLLGNVLGTVQQIFKAATDAGGQILGALGAVFGELERILAAPQMQAQMRSLFASVAQIVGAIVPVIGAVVQAVVPLMAAIAQPIATLATALGPVLQQLATTLGAALTPIVQALAPALVMVGTTIVQIVQAVMPLLQPIAALISGVLTALAPALAPVLAIATQLVGLLIGPLMQVIQVLTPALILIADMITAAFRAFEPLLAPAVDLLTMVAQLVADVLSVALGQLMAVLTPLVEVGVQLVTTVFAALEPLLPVIGEAFTAIGDALLTMLPALLGFADAAIILVQGLAPLIPIGVQLVTTVLQALIPILPTVADAFVAISTALLGIAGPLAEMVGSIAQQLAPILTDIAPILGTFVGLLATVLAEVLPPLTEALLTLVGAFAPLFPVLAELVGMVLEMASGVLLQLLPSFMQLLDAGLLLVMALLPIVPPLAQLVGLVLELAINVLSWLLPPLLDLAGFLIGALASAISTAVDWISVIVLAFAGIVTVVRDVLGPVFQWLADKVIKPVWQGIQAAVKVAWEQGIRPVFGAIQGGVRTAAEVFRWLRDKVITPVWDGIKGVISGAWKYGVKPVFDVLKSAVAKVGDSFESARKAIKTAWDKIEGIAKKPIAFVIDTVYNSGLRSVWNKIAGAFGAPKLDAIHPKGFATGGVLPGYTPGKDVHRFISPTGGALDLSGGEAIMRPEFTRGVGPQFVHYFNQIARSSGADGVRRALAPVLGGNPRTGTDRSLRYARGGVHQAFADGGIFGWIGKAASATVGAGTAAWNTIKKGASWLADTLEASARAGVKNVVDPLLKSFPGMDTGFGQMLRRVPTKILDALFGYSKEADGKGAGGIGGPRIQAALKWAKTQNGLPYQWAGNGNPSWDCSGFMSAIESVIRGQKPHRRWSTHAFHGKTAPPGWVLNGNSPFRVGITADGVGHTAGTLGRTNVESRGGDGVVVGKGARGYNDRLFQSWYGFQPGKYDAGGFLQPGFNLAYNGTGKPEPVLTGRQFNDLAARGTDDPITVEIHTQDRALADFIDVRVHRNNQELMTVINAS